MRLSMDCDCRTCQREAAREWAERVRERREEIERQRREAYERKHGPCPTVTEILERNGVRR